MKITERRLRSIIKSVIKESMEDYMSPPPRHRRHDPHNRILDEVCAGEYGAFCRKGYCEVEYLDDDSYLITTGYYDSRGTQQVLTYNNGQVTANIVDVDLRQSN